MARHQDAVETAIQAAGNKLDDIDKPLIELVRVLAEQMDAAGPDPSTRLTASYLSSLKDLRRTLGDGPAVQDPASSRLAQLRSMHGRRT